MVYKQKRRSTAGRTTRLLAGTLIASLGAAPALAADWKFGNVEVNLKSTVTAGLGIRTVDPDGGNISVLNGGRDMTVAAENFDDGNLNYRRGDVFSATTRMMHEVDVEWENLGAFVSVAYFYDFMNNDASSTRRTDLSKDARQQAGRGLDLYDAYVYGDFDVAGMPLTLRAGNQVINWGEAIFRPGGVAQTNAMDISKLVTPGTNIREGYLPSPMIYANIAPFPGFSLEAYYQFRWRKTELPPVGTFHSTEDLFGAGYEGMFFAGDPGGTGLTPQQIFALGMGIPRGADERPSQGGQFGLAARYFADSLATELSLYYLNYHAKTPYVGGTAELVPLPFPPFATVAPTSYFGYFPEDIDLYGASVSFPLGPVAIGAEAVFQPDFPLMLDDAITAAGMETLVTLLPSRNNGVVYADRWNFVANAAISVGPNIPYIGHIPSLIGADALDLYGEAGLVNFDKRPLGVSGDTTAWGFTTSASATYTNVLVSGLTLTPSISFNCDVNGTALDRSISGTPVEGKRAVSLGVSANLRNTYSASVSYTNNIGGGLISRNSDRDFVTFTASYSF